MSRLVPDTNGTVGSVVSAVMARDLVYDASEVLDRIPLRQEEFQESGPCLAMKSTPFLVCLPQIRQEGLFHAPRYTQFSEPRQ